MTDPITAFGLIVLRAARAWRDRRIVARTRPAPTIVTDRDMEAVRREMLRLMAEGDRHG